MPRGRTDIQAIKDRIDPIAVISRYVSLKKAGKSYKGKCPFHKDDTPSFVVDPEKGLWHCFGCGEGGDIVSFLMKIERISFVDAARRLAAEAGVDFQTSEDEGDREALRSAMADAASYFVKNLRDERKGRRARAYLIDRGYSEEVWERFELGCALPGWDSLKKALAAEHGEERLVELGLLVKGDKGTYDRFRDRTIFPVLDLSGRPIAFGGRAFEGEPKYLNSPKTPLFDKGRTLYGLSWAREAFSEERTALLVEGYTDVITLHDAGVRSAVASMGTALTQGQADVLARFVDEVVIVYDRDAAGGAAALRGMQILGNSGLSVRIARLDEGDDPDSLVRRDGPGAFRSVVDDAIPFYVFYVEELGKQFDASSIGGKERILSEARQFAGGVRSLPLRRAFAEQLAGLLDLSSEGIFRELEPGRRRAAREPEVASLETWTAEEDLLVLLLRGEISWERVSPVVTPDTFSPDNRPIVRALADADKTSTISEVMDGLDEESARRVSRYALATVRFDDAEKATDDALSKLVQIPSIERRISELDAQIAACERDGNWERWNELEREKVALVSEKLARKGMHGKEK